MINVFHHLGFCDKSMWRIFVRGVNSFTHHLYVCGFGLVAWPRTSILILLREVLKQNSLIYIEFEMLLFHVLLRWYTLNFHYSLANGSWNESVIHWEFAKWIRMITCLWSSVPVCFGVEELVRWDIVVINRLSASNIICTCKIITGFSVFTQVICIL